MSGRAAKKIVVDEAFLAALDAFGNGYIDIFRASYGRRKTRQSPKNGALPALA